MVFGCPSLGVLEHAQILIDDGYELLGIKYGSDNFVDSNFAIWVINFCISDKVFDVFLCDEDYGSLLLGEQSLALHYVEQRLDNHRKERFTKLFGIFEVLQLDDFIELQEVQFLLLLEVYRQDIYVFGVDHLDVKCLLEPFGGE